MKRKGIGIARQAMPPIKLAAGPTPRLWNIGFAANGSPAANKDLSMVFAEIALAEYGPYVSIK